jgi:hypothetical protein
MSERQSEVTTATETGEKWGDPISPERQGGTRCAVRFAATTLDSPWEERRLRRRSPRSPRAGEKPTRDRIRAFIGYGDVGTGAPQAEGLVVSSQGTGRRVENLVVMLLVFAGEQAIGTGVEPSRAAASRAPTILYLTSISMAITCTCR